MAKIPISEFTKKVMQLICQIPRGKVATYKQIAELAGKPHGARGVAWILHSCSTTYGLPWHRVINSQGGISFDRASSQFVNQRRRLEREGVSISNDGRLVLREFQWKRRATATKIKTPLTTPRSFR